jgi:SAM-dependent methyltransferase
MRTFGAIDYPKENEIVGEILGVGGWALSENQEDDLIIEVFVDNKFLIKSKRNTDRLDVANAYPQIKNSDKSGFYVEVKLDKFEDGIHDLRVIIKNEVLMETICQRKFILNKKKLIPPQRLQDYVGGGDFEAIGKNWLNHFIDICNLKKNESILDVGCGNGRVAVALTNYLSSEGCYEGFDVVASAIEWDKQYISYQFPNFNFTLVNVYNKAYNQTTKVTSTEYKFPYSDESFDFVFVGSVFTHMRPREIENYIAEISRVLKKNGRCFVTFFLLNDESRHLMGCGKSSINFKFNFEGFSSNEEKTPENGIALPEDFVSRLFEKNNLKIVQPIHYGSWCGRTNFLDGQDVIIASK